MEPISLNFGFASAYGANERQNFAKGLKEEILSEMRAARWSQIPEINVRAWHNGELDDREARIVPMRKLEKHELIPIVAAIKAMFDRFQGGVSGTQLDIVLEDGVNSYDPSKAPAGQVERRSA